jgi:hypothetical protein
MNQSFKQCLIGGFGLALVASTLLIGCGSDDNDSPSQPTVTGVGGSNSGSGGKGGSGSTGEGGDDGNGGTNNSGGTNDNGGTSNSGGTGGTTAMQDCEAEEVDGCWICPQEPEQFLTQCTDSECEPFDNEERIPRLNEDGTVPDVLP